MLVDCAVPVVVGRRRYTVVLVEGLKVRVSSLVDPTCRASRWSSLASLHGGVGRGRCRVRVSMLVDCAVPVVVGRRRYTVVLVEGLKVRVSSLVDPTCRASRWSSLASLHGGVGRARC